MEFDLEGIMFRALITRSPLSNVARGLFNWGQLKDFTFKINCASPEEKDAKQITMRSAITSCVRGWHSSLTTNQKVPGSIPGLVEGWTFATPSVDRDEKPLVLSLDVLLGDLK